MREKERDTVNNYINALSNTIKLLKELKTLLEVISYVKSRGFKVDIDNKIRQSCYLDYDKLINYPLEEKCNSIIAYNTQLNVVLTTLRSKIEVCLETKRKYLQQLFENLDKLKVQVPSPPSRPMFEEEVNKNALIKYVEELISCETKYQNIIMQETNEKARKLLMKLFECGKIPLSEIREEEIKHLINSKFAHSLYISLP